MIKFYYSTAPNPMKVALCLEEMGLAYEPIPVDTRKGAQHKPEYLAINPNAKVPSIVDGDVTVFDKCSPCRPIPGTTPFLRFRSWPAKNSTSAGSPFPTWAASWLPCFIGHRIS